MTPQDKAKIAAGRKALEEFVEDGMTLGLGSGTTSHFFVRLLGERVRAGLSITATTTSRSTTAVAEEVGIAITDVNDVGVIDLTIDGPDEIDGAFRMIKGGGACLLWEKIVAHASTRMITVCDESKIVERLGGFPLPIEVVQFGWRQTQRRIETVLASSDVARVDLSRRERDGVPVVTDSGHFILDARCGTIGDPEELELALNAIPGVVENGLFSRESDGMCVGRFDETAYVALRGREASGG